MVHLSTFSLLATTASLVSAAPAILDARAGCTFTGAAGAAALAKGKAACKLITLSNLVVPAGQTLDLTKLASGTKVIFQGTTTFGYEEWSGPLISVSGTNIDVSGATGNVIDGGGPKYWDGKGSNGGKVKPKFFAVHNVISSSIENLNFKNSPVQLMSMLDCKNLQITNLRLDNSAGDAGKIGHNTDGIDVGSSTGITITGANIHNQDDCIAINSGSDITFKNGICIGGHGISIGSVGLRVNNAVKNVVIDSSTVKDSDNGIRVKTISGATGSVSGVTFSNIVLSNIHKTGIVVQQDYKNGSPTGTPTTGVPITGLTIKNITGSVAAGATRVYILCGKGACLNWAWAGVSFSGGTTAAKCLNLPGAAKC
ncbi:probable Polygalacturonase [Rhynchosporium secalis]|uniref:endo-polygalacturonase n=1 Tax=Rhynchosporium secalis TaxID=38038 RepID=A0A1E1LX67_RHYSE|nr:probable Polygalacturonase [Rhynchosporium secalis]